MQDYTVGQAADLLGLHVKTVRNYVRDGRLKAVKIGKQYRIAREDLEAFTGRTLSPPVPARQVEASSIVRIDGIDRLQMDRLSTMLLGALVGRPNGVRVELVYDEERANLKIIILGDLEMSAQVFRLVEALVRE
ncbi:helix-turn-helix domain-containing protein [Nonomuraea sp. LPB2021202275-12-8]|uniref:helix-turn-helix domain-containing protein n=1 Tax=Nonomuraea sp. LPB2021202275-12-8 TaxID=3120159 RepID=UPI00300CA07A